MLQMEENESIDSFVTRLTGIINKAASVGLAYEDSTLERLLFTRHKNQGQQFRRRGHDGFNQSRGQENNFKKETDNNSNKFTHDKSKVLCFKCKEYGHFANKCPSKKEEQSNLIEEDLKPTLLMAIVEEAPGSFINQEESRSKNERKFHSALN
nr:putative zinc finger, CCHC-type [Tanacetum cinerariifolium]